MKFRKKPVIVEAFKYGDDVVPEWYTEAIRQGVVIECGVKPIIKTLEGDHRVSFGDYIIKGVAGELYPCKPDIFEQTYEKVDNDADDHQEIADMLNEAARSINAECGFEALKTDVTPDFVKEAAELYELVVIFTDGVVMVINDVTEYRYRDESGLFSFVKGGRRSFIPKENVKYFGENLDNWPGGDGT